MSGRTRSTPRCSSRGNASPASTTTMIVAVLVHRHVLADLAEAAERHDPEDPVHRLSVRRFGLDGGAVEQPEPLEARPHRVALLGRRLDERQAMAADVVSEDVQRRLDRERVRRHAEEVDRRPELLVQLARPCLATGLPAPDQLLHARPDHVRVHADAAHAAELEERQDEVVVAGVELEAELDDLPSLLEVVVRLLDRDDVRDPRELAEGLGVDRDDDAARDVVRDDGLVGRLRDRLEVRDDAAGGGLE